MTGWSVPVGPRAHSGSRLDRWIAPDAPAERLAAFRILLGAFTSIYLLVRLPVFLALADGRPSAFEPVGLLRWAEGPAPGWSITALVLVAVAAAVGFTAGWRFRICGPIVAATMLFLGTYRSSWGQLLHFENLMVLHLVIVAASPATDAWAVGRRPGAAPPVGPRYGWPLRLAALTTVVTYVLAGVAKLRYGGFEWMIGDTLQNHIAYSATRLELLGGSPAPAARPLISQGWLFPPLAIATVVIEIAAPLAFVSRGMARTWALLAWAMHAGIVALMYIVFPYPLFGLAFAPLFAVERPMHRVAARLAARRGVQGRVSPASISASGAGR